jgi:hypothetical protein
LDQVQEAFTRNDKKMNQSISLPRKKLAVNNGTKMKEGDDDSSDDDIFADAGDYVPTTTTTSNAEAASTGTKSTTTTNAKVSLFSGLVTNQQDDEPDDDDVHEDGLTIVAKLAQKARAATPSKSGDFSQYHGAYGDDGMDMDFAGQCEDDDDGETTKKKKKGKGEESTMASKEYGKQRGKPPKEATLED